VFTVGNIGVAVDANQVWAQFLAIIASFSFGILTPISAVLATFMLSRKFYLISGCSWALGTKMATLKDSATLKIMRHLKHIRSVATIQQTVTAMRLLATAGAAVSLPYALALRSPQQLDGDRMIPLAIAAASVCLQVLSIICLFFVEYSVLYNLDARLGEYVCDAFDDELQGMKVAISAPLNTIQAIQVQERLAWEYVARAFMHRYRFDTVFAANRFGSIFQYVQSGLAKSAQKGADAIAAVDNEVNIRY
jgi:hypothetical protein